MIGLNDFQDDMKLLLGSFGEMVVFDWFGGWVWVCNGGVWGKENVSLIFLFVYIVGLILYFELLLFIL